MFLLLAAYAKGREKARCDLWRSAAPLRGSWEPIAEGISPLSVPCALAATDSYRAHSVHKEPLVRFYPDECALEKLERSKLRRVLANRTVVLLGDSVQRTVFFGVACAAGASSWVHALDAWEGEEEFVAHQMRGSRGAMHAKEHVHSTCAFDDDANFAVCFVNAGHHLPAAGNWEHPLNVTLSTVGEALGPTDVVVLSPGTWLNDGFRPALFRGPVELHPFAQV